jgi:hypothetical protein
MPVCLRNEREKALGVRQVFPDVGKRPIHARRQIARRVGKIAFAGEQLWLGFATQSVHDRHEELDPPNAMAMGDLGEERKNLPARALAEQHAAPRKRQQGRNRAQLGGRQDGASDEFFIELDESAAERHGLAVRNVADPVVREVGAGEDEIARIELADEIPYEIPPLCLRVCPETSCWIA